MTLKNYREGFRVGPQKPRKLTEIAHKTAFYAVKLEQEIAQLTLEKYRGFHYSPLPKTALLFSFETPCAVCETVMQTEIQEWSGNDYTAPISGTGKGTGEKQRYRQRLYVGWKNEYISTSQTWGRKPRTAFPVPIKDGSIYYEAGVLPICSSKCMDTADTILTQFEKRRHEEWQQIERAANLLKATRKLLQERNRW